MAKMKECPVCGQKVGLDKIKAHVKKVHPREKVELRLDEEEVKEVKQVQKAYKSSARPRGGVIILVSVILVVVIVLAFVFFPRGLGPGSTPPDFTLTDTIYPGATWNLNSHIAVGKPILLEFFHPDCGACKQAVPDLKTIFNRYVPNIEMVSVAITLEASGFRNPPTVNMTKDFMGTYGTDWTFLVETSGTVVRDKYEVISTPTFFLIGKDGKIAHKQIGEQPGNISELEDAIKKALQ